MINFLKNKRIIVILLVLTLTLSWVFVSIAVEPGSNDDPLISLSYFENRIKALQEEVTNNITEAVMSKFNELKLSIETSLNEIKEKGISDPAQFEVVSLKENNILICDAGTEIIIRSGRCVAIASTSGGISDVTEGKDLSNDEEITNNHLLIIPRSDGRGIKCNIEGAVMIKGTYTKQ